MKSSEHDHGVDEQRAAEKEQRLAEEGKDDADIDWVAGVCEAAAVVWWRRRKRLTRAQPKRGGSSLLTKTWLSICRRASDRGGKSAAGRHR